VKNAVKSMGKKQNISLSMFLNHWFTMFFKRRKPHGAKNWIHPFPGFCCLIARRIGDLKSEAQFLDIEP
jgi:hypothetical protein